MIRLSFIVPVYGVEKYIEECIRSLYNQDIPQSEYEVICVDDCSPDGSRAIVERLQTEYPTLHLICHAENKRQGGARNTGLREAKGQYINTFVLKELINFFVSLIVVSSNISSSSILLLNCFLYFHLLK